MYGEKETCGTKGGLVSGWKQGMKSVSNNEWREVSRWLPSAAYVEIKGANPRRRTAVNMNAVIPFTLFINVGFS